MSKYIDIVFDGPPSAESGRFVEVENEHGRSINAGEWIDPDGAGPYWRLRLSLNAGLNDLAESINKIARDHGFWEADRNFGEMIALMHSELSEALEAHREGQDEIWLRHTNGCAFAVKRGECDCSPKPEGPAVELVDCIIRCLDTLHSMDVDIDRAVQAKMAYNDSRPYKHGKAY